LGIIDSLSTAEKRAASIVEIWISLYGSRDGVGMFSGAARYGALSGRVRLAAERSRDVRSFYDLTMRTMQWSIGPSTYDDAILALIEPSDDDMDTLRAFAERTDSIIMIARSQVRLSRNAARSSEPGKDGPPPTATLEGSQP
jgi:hypothetical protein